MANGHDVLLMKPDKKGRTDTKKSGGMDWKKAALIIVGVLFAVTMIVSSLGTGWLVGMKAIQAGDSVVVEYTLRDPAGRAALTATERFYTSAYQNGELVWYTGPLSLIAGGATGEMVAPVPAFRDDYGEADFALFGQEQNQIAASLPGMKQGQTQRITFSDTDQFGQEITAEQFDQMGGNFTVARIGDQFPLAFMTSVEESDGENTTIRYAVRTAYVTGKDEQNISISYAYPVADISIVQFTSR